MPADDSARQADDDPAHRSGRLDDDSAFERLLRIAATVSVPGRLLAQGAALCDGRFVIKRCLGKGGMGVVFEALDTTFHKRVAIKTLSRVDAAGIYRMKGEFRSLAGVSHPYLVSLHELFADHGHWFFTMDLVDGVPFDRYLGVDGQARGAAERDHAPDAARLRTLLAQLSAGVQAIHDAGKLHRDLKPSNVLVAETHCGPHVAIVDFGLASEVSRPGATQTIERGLAGTPAYMAPEQALGHRATTASDWYAVGVMLFEALTGHLPFRGEALDQLLTKRTSAAPAVRSLAPHAPLDLAALCDGLLAQDPADRPTPDEILRVLGSHPNGTQNRSCASVSPPRAEPQQRVAAGVGSAYVPETFVGRAREIGLLETALADTNDGKPVFVMVAGPSGIGKTTFVEHFLSAVRARGDAVVLSGRCYHRESVPFKGFDGVIDALSHYLARLPEAGVLRCLPRQAAALCRVFPVLGRVEAISAAPQRRGLPNDPVELRYRAFDALKELFFRLAETRPLILSIDDLHWSDRDTARLLKHLLTAPEPPLLLLVATHRDDEPNAEGLLAVREALSADDGGRDVDVRTLPLGALSLAEGRRLAQQLLATDEHERVERVVREAAGSPYLIGELTRADQRDAEPGDLRSTILSRVRALPPGRRAVLSALCVAPRPVTPALVARVVEGAAPSPPDVLSEVRALLSARLGREVPGGEQALAQDGRRLAAYHDRIRETVLDALAPDERAHWHRRYASALEACTPLDLDALVDHNLGAGDYRAAGAYARRAARKAVTALAFERAASLYSIALRHLCLDKRERAALLLELAEARSASGYCGEAARALLEAAELDPERGPELERRAGEQFLINGDLDEGGHVIRRALAAAGLNYDALLDNAAIVPAYRALLVRGFGFEPRDPSAIRPQLLARVDTLWAAALGGSWLLDAPTITIACVREALTAGDPIRVARARGLLFVQVEALHDSVGAAARIDGLLSLFARLATPMATAWAALCRGALSLWSGTEDLGVADLQRAEELLSAKDNRGMVRELSFCRYMLAVALASRYGPAAAFEYIARSMRLADEAGDRWGSIEWRVSHSFTQLNELGTERARAELLRAHELARGLPQSSRSGVRLARLGWLAAIEGNWQEALERVGQAFRQHAGRGRSWLTLELRVQRACLLLGAVAHGVGDRPELLDRVERDAAVLAHPRTLLGGPIQYPVLAGRADFLRGQLAAARGHEDEALLHFERAAAAARDSPHCASYPIHQTRLGDMLGGEHAVQLCSEAERTMVALGYDARWREVHAVRFADASSPHRRRPGADF